MPKQTFHCDGCGETFDLAHLSSSDPNFKQRTGSDGDYCAGCVEKYFTPHNTDGVAHREVSSDSTVEATNDLDQSR